jgi:quinol-cytochrome oxidoreductase complex cytochrome b subunit
MIHKGTRNPRTDEEKMEQTTAEQEKKATLRSWMIIIAMTFLFLLWGLFIFFAVGDKGPPPWNFGVVEDVPGQSPYSTERR